MKARHAKAHQGLSGRLASPTRPQNATPLTRGETLGLAFTSSPPHPPFAAFRRAKEERSRWDPGNRER